MRRVPLSALLWQCRLLLVGFFAFSACTDPAPTGPSPSGAALARAAAAGKGPTVRSAVPDSATVDTTLNVRVLGSGYDQGSRADWAFKGVPSPKVVTNSTQFVSSTELVANITIARDANIGRYDVIVTTSAGKGGIGTELFAITLKAIDLGTLGGTYARAYAINNSGQIVGVSKPAAGGERATYWEPLSPTTWSIRQLGEAPSELQSGAAGINDAGVIAGWTYNLGADGITQGDPVRWLSGTSAPENLGSQGSEAGGINLAGQILGSMTVDGMTHGFLWENGVVTDLGHLGGGQSQGFRINSSGDIVGYSRVIPFPDGRTRAVVWKARVIRELPPLPGGTRDAFAYNVNDAGVIVGQSPTAAGQAHAVRWVPSAGEPSGYRIEDLGLGLSLARGINNNGEIVGEYYKGGAWRAFYWHPVNGKIDLPPLRNGTDAQALAINDARVVVGSGYPRSTGSDMHAIVWIGIP
jgi:probable HAF family extracellular repeat protein